MSADKTVGKSFVDTNVLVYAYDVSDPAKRDIARQLVAGLWENGGGLLSPQVLQEFFVTVTRKIATPLSTKIARGIVEDLAEWRVVPADAGSVLRAIELQTETGFSFWDAMIVQSAIDGGATTLWSEDLQHGRKVKGVAIRNPFAEKSSAV